MTQSQDEQEVQDMSSPMDSGLMKRKKVLKAMENQQKQQPAANGFGVQECDVGMSPALNPSSIGKKKPRN